MLLRQSPKDRSDLEVSRLFKVKLQAMMSYVMDEKLFGISAAYVNVVELQKRSLSLCIEFSSLADRVSSE